MLENMENCTGCRACEQVCPQKCISMKADKAGFLYPKVENEKCIHCNLCDKICHVQKGEVPFETGKGWYGWCEDELRLNSSSGGAFSALAEHWGLEEKTVVYGAAFNNDWNYVSQVRMSREDYAPLRKSKYVASDPKDSFSLVKRDLEEDRFVVYCGTPCQIAGLKVFLGQDYPRLLLIDFICHGTPSMQLLNQHLNYIGGGKKRKLVDFRSKYYGWRKYCLKVIYEDKIYIQKIERDLYLNKFMKNETLRKCCYSCKDSIQHASDITIADFWEIGKLRPDLHDSMGVSLIIGNTCKGKEYLPSLRADMTLYEVPEQYFSYVYKNHSQYNQKGRELFMREYEGNPYEALERKFERELRRNKVKSILKKLKRKSRKE